MTDTHIEGYGGRNEHIHRLKMDAIKWQMRLDVTKILEAFAARVIR